MTDNTYSVGRITGEWARTRTGPTKKQERKQRRDDVLVLLVLVLALIGACLWTPIR